MRVDARLARRLRDVSLRRATYHSHRGHAFDLPTAPACEQANYHAFTLDGNIRARTARCRRARSGVLQTGKHPLRLRLNGVGVVEAAIGDVADTDFQRFNDESRCGGRMHSRGVALSDEWKAHGLQRLMRRPLVITRLSVRNQPGAACRIIFGGRRSARPARLPAKR